MTRTGAKCDQLGGLGARPAADHGWRLEPVATGRIEPIVAAVFPMERAAGAQRFVREGAPFGRVLLDLSSEEPWRARRRHGPTLRIPTRKEQR